MTSNFPRLTVFDFAPLGVTGAMLVLLTCLLAATGQRELSTERSACSRATSRIPTRAEACAPATALRDLEWNNVRALIENGGALWYNRAIDQARTLCRRRRASRWCTGERFGWAGSARTNN